MGAAAQGVVVTTKLILPVGRLVPKTIRLHEWAWEWFDQIMADTEKARGQKPSYGEVIEYLLRPMYEEHTKKK